VSKWGISLKEMKTIFGVLEGTLLGKIIAKSGINLDPKMVKAIT